MSGKFSMDDYVDVAERVAMFSERFPDGSLQSELSPIETNGVITGWLCKAMAFRHPDDPTPGVGHAVEPVPGRTPYTKDSEAMNAETSAWGRAIIALGFPTKKVASRQEVQARQDTKKPAAPKAEQTVSTERLADFETLLSKCAKADTDDTHTFEWYREYAKTAATKAFKKSSYALLTDEEMNKLVIAVQKKLGELAGAEGQGTPQAKEEASPAPAEQFPIPDKAKGKAA